MRVLATRAGPTAGPELAQAADRGGGDAQRTARQAWGRYPHVPRAPGTVLPVAVPPAPATDASLTQFEGGTDGVRDTLWRQGFRDFNYNVA